MDKDVEKYLMGSLDNRYLDLILYPTEQCNFRCTYCYEDFSIGKMDSSVIQGIKNFITKRSETLKHLHLGWFGGEPLIAKDVIYEISQFAAKICEEKKLKFNGSMTTNAYHLTCEVMEELCKYNIKRFQISLDGFEEGHDATRKLMSGKGSFKRIWKNLLNLRASSHDFAVVLRMHVTPENIESVRVLAKHIKKQFGDDSRFTPFVKPVGDWGGPNSGKISALSKESKNQIVAEIESFLASKSDVADFNSLPLVVENAGQSLDASERKMVKEDLPYICYASKPNSLAIRADGRIQKCTVMLKDDRNTVGTLHSNGAVTIDDEKMKMWMRGYQTGDTKILGCPATKLPQPNKVQISEIPLVEIA